MIQNANNQIFTITILGAGAMGQLWLSQLLKHNLWQTAHPKITAQIWLKADSLALNHHCATPNFTFEVSSLIETSINTVLDIYPKSSKLLFTTLNSSFTGRIFRRKTHATSNKFGVASKQSEVFNCPANNYMLLAQSNLLLVCLKSHQILNALVQLQPHLSPKTDILLLHNGMGVIEAINAKLTNCQNRFFQGITTQAAFQSVSNNSVHANQRDSNQSNSQNLPLRKTIHTANGLTQIGPVKLALSRESKSPIKTSNQPPKWFTALAEVLPPVVWNIDIQTAQWQKLAINALINPMTVKYQCLNGELEKHQAELTILAEELARLFIKIGQSNLSLWDTTQKLLIHALQVIEQTANNRSSMLQDVLANKQTEIDSITGFILSQAEKVGLELPTHASLYKFINN